MRKLILSAACAAGAVCSAPLLAQTASIKPGGWEATHKSVVAGKAETTTSKSCIKKTAGEVLDAFVKKTPGCTHEVKSRSATRLVMASSCSGSGMQSKSDVEVTLLSPESVQSKLVMTINAGGKADTIRVESSARWRSASCAGYDEEE